MKIENIKKEFPIFNNKIENNDLVYLDSANSSQKPLVVVDRIYDFYTKEFSNIGRSVHYLAVAATNLYENTRTAVQKYINAKDKNEIVYTKGATEAINIVASTFEGNLTMDSVALTAIQTSSESFANNNTSIMTSAAIEDKILSYGYTSFNGDITSVAISSTDASISGTGTGSSGDIAFDLEVAIVDGGTY